MKKLLPIILLLVSLNLTAQHKNRERIKALKVSFITEQLDLSQKEAQEFWPVYNAFDAKTSKIKHEDIRSIRKEIRDHFNDISDEEASYLIKRFNDAENNLHVLRMEFSKKLSKIIPAKKIILLKVAEEDFKKKIFEEFKKRRKENR